MRRGERVEKTDIKIVDINKSFDSIDVLKNISLEIKAGEFFSILGPSGCGKTTLLRVIGGFVTPDSGAVYLGDKNIVKLPPNKRDVNTIFQKYALFPHLSVYENIAFPLRLKKIKETVIDSEVKKIVELVDLKEHIYKKPSQLSGGQQQRVSIARSLINMPGVLLLDEALSALDAKLRQNLLIEIFDTNYARLKTKKLGELIFELDKPADVGDRVRVSVRTEKIKVSKQMPSGLSKKYNILKVYVEDVIYSGFQSKYFVSINSDKALIFKAFKQHSIYFEADDRDAIRWDEDAYIYWHADDSFLLAVYKKEKK